ncbi:MAG: hypothetical protein ACXW4A_10305, partial [Nitrospira sp.]
MGRVPRPRDVQKQRTGDGQVGTIEDITAQKEWELAQQDFRDMLERQVSERTATLEQAITDLKQEIERRRDAESAL